MCPWVGPHAPSFGRQLSGLPDREEYLSPQGVLLPLVYGTTASLLWLELRGLSAWQATSSWTVYQLACQWLLPWLRVTFATVPDAAWPGLDQWPWGTAPAAGPMGRLGRPSAPDPWGVGSSLSLGCPTCARVCGVLGHLAPVRRCARLVRCFACAVSWATWLLFTGVPARCVALRVRCPGPIGSCSSVCPLGVLPVCAVSWATWLLFTRVPAQCVVLRVWCPGPLGSCSPVCPLSVLPVFAVYWAAWLLFTGVPARCVVLLVRCPGPLGSCSPVCPLGALLCVCGVLGHLAPVHQCDSVICCVVCAVSPATWLLFTGVPARCVVLLVRCPGPLGSCSPLCPLGVLFCLCGVLGHLAPAHRCARSVCCLRVRCPGPLGSCSRVCPLCALLCVLAVLGHLASVHGCARSVRCFACWVSWATWLLLAGVPARCVVLLVWCPGPLGSCSPVCPLGALPCVCGVLGHLAPVHRCGRSVCCLRVRCPGPLGSCSPVCPLSALPVCAVSWATWLQFTGVPAWCVVLIVRCPGPLGSCSPVFPLGVLCCVCGVLGHLAPVNRCARSVC